MHGPTQLLASLVLVVTACAPVGTDTPKDRRVALGEHEDLVCFSTGLSSFSQFSSNQLLVKRSPSDSYVLTLGFCPNLNSAEGLRISGADQCLKRGSRLEVFDTQLPIKGASGDEPDSCLVTKIQPVRSSP